MATLGSYLSDVRRLLHDANGTYWNDTDLTSFINRAMQQRDWDSGQNRSVQTTNLVIGQANYIINVAPFNTRTIDVLNLTVIWGTARYQLSQVAYSEAVSLYQPTQNYQQMPAVFAKLNPTTVVLAPIPSQAVSSEWDSLLVAADLAVSSDPDPLPYPWTDPVPFLAAHFAKIEMGNQDEAQRFVDLYNQRLRQVSGGVRGMQLQNPYAPGQGVWR